MTNFNPTARVPTAHDREIGRRIRVLRMDAGLSQTDLGEHCGITFQQVQKYENGRNRIANGRLLQIAALLKVTPAYLLTGGEAKREQGDTVIEQMLADIYGRKIAQAYLQIGDRELQAGVATFLENLARMARRKAVRK